jgi:hypothetical protein
MEFLLHCYSAMRGKTIRFCIRMISIVETIMAIVMRYCRQYQSYSLDWCKLKLLRQTVAACFNENVRHMSNIKPVHIIVIAHIEVSVTLPNLREKLL